MKKNKLIIIVAFILIIILLVILIIKQVTGNKIETYNQPIISHVSVSNGFIIVNAGVYKYGDITKDGSIDNNDIKILEEYLKNKDIFNESQINLADLNQDKKIDDEDLDILKEYAKSDNNYETKVNTLKYCLSDEENSDKCKWQKESTFNVKEEKEYYIYVMSGKKVSQVYKYEHRIIDFDSFQDNEDNEKLNDEIQIIN